MRRSPEKRVTREPKKNSGSCRCVMMSPVLSRVLQRSRASRRHSILAVELCLEGFLWAEFPRTQCCSCTKMEIMSLGFYLKVIYYSACKESSISQCQQRQKVGVGTTPNARKNPYLVLGLYIQDWRWMGSIFNSYPCDLVSLY